jgi:acyl-CoA synthetase (NDP forming)
LNAVTFGSFALDARRGLESAGLPTFEYPDMLARVAGNMVGYAAFRKRADPGPPKGPPVGKASHPVKKRQTGLARR